MDKETKLLFRKVVGQSIRKERRRQKMTIGDLAEYAMVDEKNLGRTERGGRKSDIDILIKFSKVLKVGLDELLQDAMDLVETMPEKEINKLRRERLPKWRE